MSFGGGSGSSSISGSSDVVLNVPATNDVLGYNTGLAKWQNQNLKSVYAPAVEVVNTVTSSGLAQTIPDPSVQSISQITLSANCTLAFPSVAAGKSFTLVLVQDGTGSHTVTWPTVKWVAGVAPAVTSTAGAVDWLSFACADGVNWVGFVAGLDIK